MSRPGTHYRVCMLVLLMSYVRETSHPLGSSSVSPCGGTSTGIEMFGRQGVHLAPCFDV